MADVGVRSRPEPRDQHRNPDQQHAEGLVTDLQLERALGGQEHGRERDEYSEHDVRPVERAALTESSPAAIKACMEERWLVKLPPGADPPLGVFVNGVPQVEGVDYQVMKGHLVFSKPLAKEGRLGFWRWLLMFLSVAGTYRRNDSVDVQYEVDGQTRVATGLDIQGPNRQA